MAVYDNVPDITKAPKLKKKITSSRQRSQMPGHPTSEPRGLTEEGPKNSPKTGRAASNPLDAKNNGTKVAGKGSSRDTVAQGARKASAPTPKPNGTDKKVRGQAKK